MSSPSTLNVLVGVDGRPSGQAALRHAADLAGKMRAHLDVVYVLDLWDVAGAGAAAAMPLAVPLGVDARSVAAAPEVRRERAQVETELAAARDLLWTFHARAGDPAQALCDMAESIDAYCIVVGSRGEGFVPFFERLLRPSVSHAVIHRQHRPVLVVTAPE